MRRLILAAWVTALAATPGGSLAQPAAPGQAPALGGDNSFTITCPPTVQATVIPPKGFSRRDTGSGLRNDSMYVEDDAVICMYGSVLLQFPGRACKHESGPWDPRSDICSVADPGIFVGQCVARCKPAAP